MVTTRSVLAAACLTLAMLTAAACVQVNEAMNNRDLECNAVPEDICVRLADHVGGLDRWGFSEVGEDRPMLLVEVTPVDCDVVERPDPAMARCWNVVATTATWAEIGGGPLMAYYYQLGDGTLIAGTGDEVIGTFPIE